MNLDEVERLLSGTTEEEQLMKKQVSAISNIRPALSTYNRINKKYPNTLEQLLETQAPVTSDNLRVEVIREKNYFYSVSNNMTTIPISVYDKKSFDYTNEGEDYKLIYNIVLPTEEESDDEYDLFGGSYYAEQVVNGINTASKDYLSMEAEVDKDYDGDGLTDMEEAKYGTSKYNSDTDGDGFSDKEEIDGGYDPLNKPSVANTYNNTSITDIEITSEDHIRGNINTTVTMIEYSDFECPFCKKFQPTLEKILEDYDGQVRLVYHHLPLSFHINSQKAAEASECADDQGMFWEMHDYMFANQESLNITSLKNAATELGMNPTSFNNCLDSGIYESLIKDSIAEAHAVDINGTPVTFINGTLVSGAQSYEFLSIIIDQELQ